MKQVTQSQFTDILCKDYNIDSQYKSITKFESFPVINGKRKINARYDSIIVDNDGNEFPYMLSKYVRNEEKLLNFDYIYTIYYKTLDQILKEIPITLNSESCKICEGGGWYSTGTRYFYKEIYCEI